MKRQLILSSALALLITTVVSAQEFSREASLDLPITDITFDETEFTFGKVKAGDIVQHIFRFTNAGDEPLVLSNAKGSCGCTVPSWPKDPIPPGGSGAIVVQFDSKGKSGPQTKQVTITANTDPAQSIFYIKGEVIGEAGENATEVVVDKRPEGYWPVKAAAYEVSVYPNPASGDFWVKVKDAEGLAASIEVFNGNGQLVDKKEVTAIGAEPIKLDATNYLGEPYWLSVKVGDAKRVSLPFVVAK